MAYSDISSVALAPMLLQAREWAGVPVGYFSREFQRSKGTEVPVESVPIPIRDAPKILGIVLEMLEVPTTRVDPSPRPTNPTEPLTDTPHV